MELTWTEVTDLNTGKTIHSTAGTPLSALAVGGNPAPGSAVTESWNGTNWTEITDLNTPRERASGLVQIIHLL